MANWFLQKNIELYCLKTTACGELAARSISSPVEYYFGTTPALS
jgi:hypothetical protein